MDQEALQKRIEELTAIEQHHHRTLQEAQANINAVNGAKQDCQYWIEILKNLPTKPDNQQEENTILTPEE